MRARRTSGILLHVTSLPSRFGIGDLGPEAHAWVDFLAAARQHYWQVLPLGPTTTGGGNSPYLASSAFAGNPLLVSPELLAEEGLLDTADLDAAQISPGGRVDYDAVERGRRALLARAYQRFSARGRNDQFDAFCAAHASWLHPFALFRAIAERHPALPWWEWAESHRGAGRTAPGPLPPDLGEAVRREKFIQFEFERQWSRLRAHARERGVHVFGDVPFYVGGDSADTWGRPDLFKLDATGRARFVAGVPPDAFSDTGQLWGNPVYDWQAHAGDGYAWWMARLRRSFEWYDVARLDHFRGLVAHWEVPAGSPTAAGGEWVQGPGRALLTAAADALPGAHLVAEDLGIITPEVRELMRAFGVPGMKVLLFAFDGDSADNSNAPHNHVPDAVVYTGTHDNNTSRGWFETDADAAALASLARYLGHNMSADDVTSSLVRLAMMSVCRIAIIPMQDILDLDGRARMNRPASPAGNWEWRLEPGQLTPELAKRVAALTETYGRT
jgi:4-alpha-glucanotransferase